MFVCLHDRDAERGSNRKAETLRLRIRVRCKTQLLHIETVDHGTAEEISLYQISSHHSESLIDIPADKLSQNEPDIGYSRVDSS